MATFERPAVEIQQGNLALYLTYVTPEDLFNNDFYAVSKLEPTTEEGYQRILNAQRANRLARHLKEAFPKGYAHIPTTVFLATEHPVDFDQESGRIRFETDEVCPFSVVDGQHRIEGLKRALDDDDSSLCDFKLPATIAVDLDHTHQMYHFYIVNTTQKPIDAGLSQQITSRFTNMKGIKDLPYFPHWLDREVERGTDAKALKLVEFLNNDASSPLNGRVRMANDETRRGNRNEQASIVSIFKREIFTGNPVARERDYDRLHAIMLNYFEAVNSIFVANTDPDSSIVWRNNGLFFFSLISKWILEEIYATTRKFTVESIRQMIKGSLEELDAEYQSIAYPQWWQSGAGASGMNRAAFRRYAVGFHDALRRFSNMDIEV